MACTISYNIPILVWHKPIIVGEPNLNTKTLLAILLMAQSDNMGILLRGSASKMKSHIPLLLVSLILTGCFPHLCQIKVGLGNTGFI